MHAYLKAINAALSPVAEDPKLVGNYTGIAIATFLAGIAFYLCFWRRDQNGAFSHLSNLFLVSH